MEVVGDANSDNAGMKVRDGESHPGLIFVVGAQVDGTPELEVGTAAEGVHVEGDVGDVVMEVIDAATVEDLGVGDKRTSGEEDSRANLVGALVDGRVGRGPGVAEVEFAAPVVSDVECRVESPPEQIDRREIVVGFCEYKARPDLEVADTAGRGLVLRTRLGCREEGCRDYEHGRGKDDEAQATEPEELSDASVAAMRGGCSLG